MSDDVVAVSVPVLIHMTAGCIAGAIETTATWPMEYIKTQLQLQRPASTPTKSSSIAVSWDEDTADGIFIDQTEYQEDGQQHGDVVPPRPYIYTGVISGIIYTVRTYGFCALYHGLFPTLLGSIPKAGIRFGLFAWFSELLRDGEGNLSLAKLFLAGLAAGMVEALVVVVPVETVKTKCIQLKLSFFEGLVEILLLEGLGGIYDGVFATVLKQSSNHGLRFLWYHEYKRIVSHDGLYHLTPLQSFIGGMTAGMFSSIGNQPFDVLKTRMQGIRSKYSSTLECIYETFRWEGIAGFYRGIIPRLARVVPGQGIIFMSYELIVSILMALQQS